MVLQEHLAKLTRFPSAAKAASCQQRLCYRQRSVEEYKLLSKLSNIAHELFKLEIYISPLDGIESSLLKVLFNAEVYHL